MFPDSEILQNQQSQYFMNELSGSPTSLYNISYFDANLWH